MQHGRAAQAPRSWWGQLHRGLVVDEKGSHYRRMRLALWLFAYFVIHANRQDGTLRRKHETIAKDMGVSLSTVRRWMSVLRKYDYIAVDQTGRAQLIHIKRWKTATRLKTEHSDRSGLNVQTAQIRQRTSVIGKPFPA